MKRNKGKILAILLIVLSLIAIQINTYAHSGKTDSSGGHKDNKNKSGLGSYHYHCGGYPAHLHTNGVCPYSSNASSKSSTSTSSSSKSSNSTSNSTSSSSPKKSTTTAPATINVTKIQINENIQDLEIGQSKTLTVTITPDNATDKSVTWKSDNESIATINSSGEIMAKKDGIVNITATSSNGKTSTIKLNIKEEQEADNNIMADTITETTNSNKINNVETNDQSNNSNLLGEVITLGLLGGGGYLGYRKLKKCE